MCKGRVLSDEEIWEAEETERRTHLRVKELHRAREVTIDIMNDNLKKRVK